MPGNQYLKPILNQVAWSNVKSRKSPLNRWFWSRQGKLGKKKAIVAVERKILTLIFTLVSRDILYDENVAMANVKH